MQIKKSNVKLGIRLFPFFIALVIFSGCRQKLEKKVTTKSDSDSTSIIIDTHKTIDNLVVLLGASAKLSEGINVKWPEYFPKHFWVEGIDKTTESLQWNVISDKNSDFHLSVLLNAQKGEEFCVEVLNNKSKLKFKAASAGWDKLDAGAIKLEKGNNMIKLSKVTNLSSSQLKAIELIPQDKYLAYLKRVEDFKVNSMWFANSGYGLMFQYGPWTFPENGDVKKSNENLASSFDITHFVERVRETGASYVIWSLTWWDYSLLMPSKAVDRIVGNNNRTTTFNFIGKLANELQKNNIRFMLYYHLGHASHLGGKTDWWLAQKWPAQFTSTGLGNRDVFFKNWMDVVKEVGDTLGENLSGWFFDDGLIYYPAPFEQMGAAARSGNPGRLISYNSWECARYTEFQDVYFGEGSHGEIINGSNLSGENGIFVSGPQKGLLQHAMFIMEDDWGIHKPNQKINTKITKENAINWLESSTKRKVPLSFNLMMWEDGSMAESSLEIFKSVKAIYKQQ